MSLISNVKIWPNKTNHKTIKARGSFTVSEAFSINFTLFAGKDGLFVGLPGRKSDKLDENGKAKYYHDVYCLSDDARKELQDKVVAAYKNETSGDALSQGEAPGATDQSQSSSLPF